MHQGSPAMDIRLHILEQITNGFSVDSKIGRGGYGDVYKGVYNGEVIAMKLLHGDTVQGLDDQQFKNEVGNLLRVKHPNIVRLLGYCYETRFKFVKYNGEDVFGKHIYRVLCFEYLQGGSLDMHLHAPSLAPNWITRYNIIKGVCEGLNFLHGCEPPILHLDLKPANILLDSSMESKVADLGLSRLFSRSHTHVTEKIVGTQKYMPPEFMKHGIISSKNDVFSLGVVIIEIMTGPTGYSDFSEMGGAQFMQEVLTNWSTVIEATWKYRSEEIHQVKTCIKLAIRCVDSERDNRPTVADILDTLNKTESHIPKRQEPVQSDPTLLEGTVADCNMIQLSARSLDIAWGDNPQFWRWTSPSDSRFGPGECAQLLRVNYLKVSRQIAPNDLPAAATSYTAYLVYKLAGSTSGLKDCVQTASTLHGQRVIASSPVSLHPEAPKADGVTYPGTTSSDGWLELRLGEFSNERAVTVQLHHDDDHVEKSGLIIKGMEVRSH